MLTRLEETARRLALLEEELRAERQRRDELVTEAREDGITWRGVAAAAHCSISRCVAIVAGD